MGRAAHARHFRRCEGQRRLLVASRADGGLENGERRAFDVGGGVSFKRGRRVEAANPSRRDTPAHLSARYTP